MPAGEEQGQHFLRKAALFHYSRLQGSICPRRGKRLGALISKRPEGEREENVLPWVAQLEMGVGGRRNEKGSLLT